MTRTNEFHRNHCLAWLRRIIRAKTNPARLREITTVDRTMTAETKVQVNNVHYSEFRWLISCDSKMERRVRTPEMPTSEISDQTTPFVPCHSKTIRPANRAPPCDCVRTEFFQRRQVYGLRRPSPPTENSPRHELAKHRASGFRKPRNQ